MLGISKEQEMVPLTITSTEEKALEIEDETPEIGHDNQKSVSASQTSKLSWIAFLFFSFLVILLPIRIALRSSYVQEKGDIIIPDTSKNVTSNRTVKNNTVAVISPLLLRKKLQINNYIKGKALALTIHITHHAGTSLCRAMRRVGPAPAFVCMGKGKTGTWPENTTTSWPWGYEETGPNIEKLRPFFHFMSWEFKDWKGSLHNTNWDHENLVSMIPMRHPIDRFLAIGKCGPFHEKIHGDPDEVQQEIYWEYANSKCADNYALRVLSNRSDCVKGFDTSQECLESAKNLLRKFTFILNQDCFDDSLVAMGKILHIPSYTFSDMKNRPKIKSARDRINNDTLYEFLLHRFRRDIELYEWSKSRSIMIC